MKSYATINELVNRICIIFLAFLFYAPLSSGQNGIWSQKFDMPTKRCWASSCELDGKIYVMGGISSAGWIEPSISTVEVYDPVADSWDTTKTSMPTSRTEFSLCAVNGKIYAIGGVSFYGDMPMGNVEEYNPLTDTWDKNKSPMQAPRTSQACGVIRKKIYIAGGTAFSSWKASDKLEIYDPATDSWSFGSNMPIARYHPSSTVLNDTLYIFGGLNTSPPYEGYKTVQKYDPITDSWSIGTELLSQRVGLTTNVVGQHIYVIGGESAYTSCNNVEKYDPTSQSWSIVGTIPEGLFLHTATVFNNTIYTFGGSRIMSNPTPSSRVYSYHPPEPTSVFDKNKVSDEFLLYQNYPNPFNPSTVISYQIPATVDALSSAEVQVTLKVFDILGREVTTLVNEKQKPGLYEVEWNLSFDGSNYTSGAYFYQLKTGNYSETKKMLLIR